MAVLTGATLTVAALVFWNVIRPGYLNPANRTYTSRLGYPALLRMRNEPFPVGSAHVEQRLLTARFLGEGLVRSEPVQVPVVPMGRIARVYVKQGDQVRRGQLLAELDSRLAELQIAATKAAIDVAAVTLERTKIGSPAIMPYERPELDRVRLERAQQEAALAKSLLDIYEDLMKKGAQSIDVVVRARQTLAQATGDARAAQADLKISSAGRPLSIRAAELTLQQAKLTLEREMEELKDYKISAVADGIVDQVLIHEGEYRSGAGTPAFTLAVGSWFGAYLDQTAVGRFEEGTPVDVRLEAFPGRAFSGKVEKIIPIVTYREGGPEAVRPVRPLGTGAPEWPATFEARIALDKDAHPIVPGLTGFAEVRVSRNCVAVPRAGLTSVSAGKAVAYVVNGERFRSQEVTTGLESDGWVEIQSGLSPGMEVLTEGQEVLRSGDRIAVSAAVSGLPSADAGTPPTTSASRTTPARAGTTR